ncbi:PTS glucose transporter subunit IIA [Ruminococcus sp. FC2018]|uniref:PTS glucose transporter subunit IIA n=1 Tax=Ruminococcus sp. FC2018 TaxID=1410617 RepID=UPI00048D1E28|nr:PTS glucose transporter subunit IIA [Ruminococcus sp. FC2018]
MKLFGEKQSEEKGKGELNACCNGELCALEDTGDDIMSSGILGVGYGIYPDFESGSAEVVSPVSARVIDVSTKPDAVVLKTADGLKVLVSFSAFSREEIKLTAKIGDNVETGDKLAVTTPEGDIKRAVFVVVENSDILMDYKLKKGSIAASETAMKYSL